MAIIKKNATDFMNELSKTSLTNCSIEICDACNFKCKHCYLYEKQYKFMTEETFNNILNQLAEIGCWKILLTGGETMLHPFFVNFYEKAKQKGFQVSINTNISLLNKKIINAFKFFQPDKIEVSLYGYDEESYKIFTGNSGVYKKIVENIKLLKSMQIPLSLKTVLTKNNKDSFLKIKKLAEDLKINFRYDYIIFPKIKTEYINGKLRINNERLDIESLIDIFKQDEDASNYFINKIKEEKFNIYKSEKVFECIGAEKGIHINVDGNVNMCVIQQKNSININDKKLKDILKELNKIKQICFDKNDRCSACSFKKICRYCPGRNMLETGDYKKADIYYCQLSERLLEEFSEKILAIDYQTKFLHDNDMDSMFEILKNNMKLISKTPFTDENKEIWKSNLLKSTEEELTTIIKLKKEIIGYAQYNTKGFIYEIQIKKEYRSKYNLFKKILKKILDNTNLNVEKIRLNISENNIKSQSIFKYIGFVQDVQKVYWIDRELLYEYVNT